MWHAALVQHGDWILIGADRQQCRKIPRVLLEEIEDRGYPALAKPHPWAYTLSLQLVAARIGALLEQRDAGFGHQLLPEQERRIRPEATCTPAIAWAAFQ